MPIRERLRRQGPVLLAALTLAGAFCVQFRELLFAGRVPVERDLRAYYWPVKSLLAPLARASGGIPLWNPFFASGQPFAANPEHAFFHPLTALFLVLRFDWAFRLQVLLPVALAACAMFFLARSLSLSPTASFLASGSWAFGGYVLSTTNLLPILHAVAVLPAVLAFAARIGRGGGRSNVGGLGLSFGLEILAGEPSTLLMTGILAPAAALHGLLLGPAAASSAGGRDVSRAVPRLAWTGLALALGCGVGAALLLPGGSHALKTVRAEGLPASAARDWSFPPVRLLEAAVPDLCAVRDGSPTTLRYGAGLYPGRQRPFLLSVYPGLFVLGLAFLGWLSVGPAARVWLPVAALGALLGVGDRLPLWPAARGLPLLSGLRYPEKFLLLTSLALVVSAAAGLDALLATPARLGKRLAVAFVGTGVALALLAAAAPWLEHGFVPAAILTPRTLRQAVLAGLLAAGCALASRTLRPRRVAASLAALSLVDLVATGRALVPSASPASLATPPPAIRRLLDNGFTDSLFHLAAYHAALKDLPGLAAPPIPAQWRVRTALDRDFDLTELAWSTRATAAISRALREEPGLAGPILARRGIGAVLRFRPGIPAEATSLSHEPMERLLELSRVRDVRPIAFCVDTVVSASGPEGWRSAAAALGDRALSAAVLDEDAGGARRAGASALPAAPSPCQVRVDSWRPDELDLDVKAAGPAASVVAVNQTWDSGWEVSVDRRPAPYLLTDLSLGAFAVAPGRHAVRVVYRDPLVSAGLVVSAFAVALCCILLRTPRVPARR